MGHRTSTPVDIAPAAADLRTKEGCFGKLVAGVALCTVLGERPDCIIANTPNTGEMTSGHAKPGEIARVRVGAVAVAAYVELTTDALAAAKTAIATNIVFAKALEAGNPGVMIDALVVPQYAKP